MRAGLTAALAVGAITAIVALPAGATGDASAGKRAACPLSTSEQRNLGASYVYTLKVTNVSCEKGKKLVLKFHECRHDNGGADGTCNSVKGYSCKTKITAESPSQLNAKAKCEKGSKAFKQTFGENT